MDHQSRLHHFILFLTAFFVWQKSIAISQYVHFFISDTVWIEWRWWWVFACCWIIYSSKYDVACAWIARIENIMKPLNRTCCNVSLFYRYGWENSHRCHRHHWIAMSVQISSAGKIAFKSACLCVTNASSNWNKKYFAVILNPLIFPPKFYWQV